MTDYIILTKFKKFTKFTTCIFQKNIRIYLTRTNKCNTRDCLLITSNYYYIYVTFSLKIMALLDKYLLHFTAFSTIDCYENTRNI